MKKKLIKAVFTGENGSMGFEKDKQYLLVVEHNRKVDGDIRISLATEEPNRKYKCEYESMISFLNNWDNIIVIA